MSIEQVIEHANILSKKQVISSKELKILKSKCSDCLSSINNKLKMYIEIYNTLLFDISALLECNFPNDYTVGLYSSIMKTSLDTDPLVFLSLFIVYVYANNKYKRYIIAGDEAFFLDNDHGELIGTDMLRVQQMFQMKEFWLKMSEESKQYVKNVMKTMIQICDQYVIEKDNGNIVAEIMLKHLSEKC